MCDKIGDRTATPPVHLLFVPGALNNLVATCILCISTATAFAAVQEKTEPYFMPDPGRFR
jgi:hypothetical protein